MSLPSADAAENQQGQLILNIPGDVDFPQEALSLTIKLPNKIQPSKEVKKETKKVVRHKIDFDTNPIEEISSRSRFKPIMTRLTRKGLLRTSHDIRTVRNIYTTKEQAARIIITAFDNLMFMEKKQTLKRNDIRVQDIKDLKELVDEFQRQIKMFTYQPTQMHEELDKITKLVSKTEGKGTIRIIGLEESDDGTLLKLEISKQ
jgi:hypothetical protein